jgi:isopentenyl-diphosphate delta-isomerase
MEMLDEVNEKNELTGNSYERKYMHENNICHRHVSAWIINDKGKILMQRRAYEKKKNPGKWAKTGGHVDSNESPEESIRREIYEEIGLDIPEENINTLNIFKSKNPNESYFSYNFLFLTDRLENEFNLQKEEVAEVKYFTIEELEKNKADNNDEFTFIKWNDEDFYKEMDMLKKVRSNLVNKKTL